MYKKLLAVFGALFLLTGAAPPEYVPADESVDFNDNSIIDVKDLTTTGDATVGGDLEVTGANTLDDVTVGGTLDVTGATTVDDLTATGTSDLVGVPNTSAVSDCEAETGGVVGDFCVDTDDQALFMCTTATCEGAGWVAQGGGGGGHTIKNDDDALTARDNLKFTGDGVTCADDGPDDTTCTVDAHTTDTGPIPNCVGSELQSAADVCITDLAELNTALGTGLVTGSHTAEVETSSLWWNVSAKPPYVSPWSDFFDDNSTNPDLVGYHWIDLDKWTLWDVDGVAGGRNGRTEQMYTGTAPEGSAYDMNYMLVHHNHSTSGGWIGFYQDVPVGSFTITTKVGCGTYNSNGNFSAGVFIAEDLDANPATAEFISNHLHSVALKATIHDYSQYVAEEWTDFDTTSGNAARTTPGPFPGTTAWLKIMWNGTRFETTISTDGSVWREFSRVTPDWTPGSVGFGMYAGNADGACAFEFVAIINQALRERPAGHGRLVESVLPVLP
jgi:hypothetical protein